MINTLRNIQLILAGVGLCLSMAVLIELIKPELWLIILYILLIGGYIAIMILIGRIEEKE